MRRARCWMFAALALLPLTACVLFDGPSDYPPRDAGSGQDATSAGDAHDATPGSGDVANGDGPTVPADGPLEAHPADGAPPGDARPDSMCGVPGAACTQNITCCSGLCQVAGFKCK